MYSSTILLAFDLIDERNQILVQVSTDSSRDKITHTFSSAPLCEYRGYRLVFFFIVDKCPKYRKPYPPVPDDIDCDIERGVYDVSRLVGRIRSLDLHAIQEIYQLVREEFSRVPDVTRLASGLAEVVSLLGNHDLTEKEVQEVVTFSIDDKIALNGLVVAADDIRECAVYAHELESIYASYDKGGSNRRLALFHHIKRVFREVKAKCDDPDERFFGLIRELSEETEGDFVGAGFAREELELYVTIVVVDAFMRCKVFDGPDVLRAPRGD